MAGPRFEKPGRYLVRMAAFLILCAFGALIFHKPLWEAFQANPLLNGVILTCLGFGIVLALWQTARLYPGSRYLEALVRNEGAAPVREPPFLAPVAETLRQKAGEQDVQNLETGQIVGLIEGRLQDSRDILRYLAGLLVFLGLLGTFWGLIETVGSVGRIIASLRGSSESGLMFDELKTSLAAPLAGMGIAFSSSLFGLAGSLILGFLDLQAGQAQNRFLAALEDWLLREPAAGVIPPPTMPRAAPLHEVQSIEHLSQRIELLVQNMRLEQQMIRDWVEAQAEVQRDLRAAIERLASKS